MELPLVGQLYNGLKITLAFWTIFFSLSLQIANDPVHQSLLNNFFSSLSLQIANDQVYLIFNFF